MVIENPMEDPELAERVRLVARNHVRSCIDVPFECYLYRMAAQDDWDNVLKVGLNEEDYQKLDQWFEYIGVFPSTEICKIFDREEMRVFGTCVTNEL